MVTKNLILVFTNFTCIIIKSHFIVTKCLLRIVTNLNRLRFNKSSIFWWAFKISMSCNTSRNIILSVLSCYNIIIPAIIFSMWFIIFHSNPIAWLELCFTCSTCKFIDLKNLPYIPTNITRPLLEGTPGKVTSHRDPTVMARAVNCSSSSLEVLLSCPVAP